MIAGLQTAFLAKVITHAEMARIVLKIQMKYNKDGSLKQSQANWARLKPTVRPVTSGITLIIATTTLRMMSLVVVVTIARWVW